MSWCFPFYLSSTLFLYPLLQGSLNSWLRNFYGDSPFRIKYPSVPHSLHIVLFCISVCVSLYWRKKLLWWWLNKKLTYSRISYGVILWLCSFSRTIVFSFFPSPRGSWSNSVRYDLHLMRWLLNKTRYWFFSLVPQALHHYCNRASCRHIPFVN